MGVNMVSKYQEIIDSLGKKGFDLQCPLETMQKEFWKYGINTNKTIKKHLDMMQELGFITGGNGFIVTIKGD